MNIFGDLDDRLQTLLRQLRDIHVSLDELKRTGIELNNTRILEEIEEVRILLRVLRINGRLACEKFENRVEFLNEEQADR